ncbi:MAG: bifunctional 2-C-methyl-D-erythritol 4-phosphate cytidylyltransferase/2-C-methyl-D-erythritol 2,4-cyclodiphosphate synthase [Roseovarius sp.]
MSIAAIIVAAGRGTRAGGDAPKQWRPLAGARVIDWTIAAFEATPEIARVVVVLHPEETGLLEQTPTRRTVPGGATRAASVRAGLEALEGTGTAHVLIHDAARCCITPALIRAVIEPLEAGHPAAALALPLSDALWRGAAGAVAGTLPRDGLFRAQTPQGFDYALIHAAHAAFEGEPADDVEVARAAGLDVAIVEGDERNLKITTPGDFARAETLLRGPMDIRIGTGFDVHRFGPGDAVVLCGIAVPHGRGLQGHSDADVGMHALTDAIYGALAEGDIGRHFPPTDPQWKGAESHVFLRHAVELAATKGFRINNMDVTLVCERPKITPHAPAMIAALSQITGVEPSRISVKATTSERLGFTGREEGIAAQAAVTLVPA